MRVLQLAILPGKSDIKKVYYMETVGVKWPGLKDTNFKLSDTLGHSTEA